MTKITDTESILAWQCHCKQSAIPHFLIRVRPGVYIETPFSPWDSRWHWIDEADATTWRRLPQQQITVPELLRRLREGNIRVPPEFQYVFGDEYDKDQRSADAGGLPVSVRQSGF